MKMLRVGSLLLVMSLLVGAVGCSGKSTAPATVQTLQPGRIPQPPGGR